MGSRPGLFWAAANSRQVSTTFAANGCGERGQFTRPWYRAAEAQTRTSPFSAYFRLIPHISAFPREEPGSGHYENHIRRSQSQSVAAILGKAKCFRRRRNGYGGLPKVMEIRNLYNESSETWQPGFSLPQATAFPPFFGPKNQGGSRWLKLNQGESRHFETFFYAKNNTESPCAKILRRSLDMEGPIPVKSRLF